MFSRSLALSCSMVCCLRMFSLNPHLEEEASQHLPNWKLTESNPSGLMVDPSFSQIHPRSGENKHPAAARTKAPAGRADFGESRAPPVIPSESRLLRACQVPSPLTSRMGDPCLPGGRREGSSATERTLGLHAGVGQGCKLQDSCPRLAADPHPKRASLCKYEAAAQQRTRPTENTLSLSRRLILHKLGNVFLAPDRSPPGAKLQA